MANRYITGATASGTWLGATGGTFSWNSFSTLSYPLPIDDVYANGKTVTIDSGITINSLRTAVTPETGTGGGIFSISTNTGMTITTNISAGTTTCLLTTHNDNTITIIGNVSGSTTTATINGVTHSGLGVLSISGDVRGGSQSNTIGVNITNTGGLDVNNCPKVYITGNTIGGTNATTTPAILSTALCYVEINGSMSAGTLYPSVQMTNQLSLLVVKGDIVSNRNIIPFYGFNIKCSPNNNQNYIVQDTSVSSANTTFSTTAYTYGLPATSDVRSGVKYGYLSGLTGTMVIPPFSAVSVGFLVDNGSGTGITSGGTAITSIRDIGNMLGGYLG